MDIGAALGAVTGLVGAYSGMEQNKQAAGYNRAAARNLDLRNNGMDRSLKLAQDYNPEREDQAAIDFANKDTMRTLNESLSQLNTDFRNSGGSPTGDTLFRVNANDVVNRATSPLMAMKAQMASTRTQRRLQALQQALSSGGDIAGDYMALAKNSQVDLSGSVAALTGGITGLTKKKTPPTTGDA